MRPMDLESDSVASLESSGIVYDAAIAFSSEDAEEAKQIMKMMNNIDLGNGRKPDVCLYNHPLFSPSKVKKICCVVKKCSFIFVLLTENCKGDSNFHLFLEEAIGITRLDTCGNCGTPPTLVQKKYCSVRPLHTQLKGTRRYGIPLGLTTIEGFCLEKPSILEDLKDFFNCFKNEKCLPKDSLKTLSLPASEGTSSARPISETSVSETSVYAIGDPTHVTSLGKDINKESALIQEKSEIADNGWIPADNGWIPDDNGWIPDDKDSGYTESENTFYSNSASNCPSILISQKNKDIMVQGTPQNISRRKAKSWPYLDMIENGRHKRYGNSRASSRTPMDSVPLPATISKKMSRKPKGKKVANRMIGCNFVQIGCSSLSPGNHYRETLSMLDNQDDSDTEWSNEDPVTQFFKSNEGSDKQDSAEQTVAPSNSTETFNLFYHNDNAKTPIEENTDLLQEYGAISSHKSLEISSTIPGYDSNEDNPEDLQQAVDDSACSSMPSVDAMKFLDSQDPLQQCSGSQTPIQQGSESQDPLQQGSESLDPYQLGSGNQTPMQGSESQDPLLQGSESVDPLQPCSGSQNPMQQGSERVDPLQQVSGSQTPMQLTSERDEPWKCKESLPGEESVSSQNQPQGQEELICQQVLSLEEPLSMGSILRECFEDADGTRVPLIVNQDQLGFSRAEENHLHGRFSQPETFPFSYHSLHSNHLADRQISFLTIAKLSGVFKIASDELD